MIRLSKKQPLTMFTLQTGEITQTSVKVPHVGCNTFQLENGNTERLDKVNPFFYKDGNIAYNDKQAYFTDENTMKIFIESYRVWLSVLSENVGNILTEMK